MTAGRTTSRKRTSSTGKKTSSTTGKKTSGRKKKTSGGIETGIFKEAIILIMVALSIIFFIANFGVGGVVGAAISKFFFGLFGLIAYIFPLLLLFGTFFAISNKNNSVARIKLIAAVFVVIFLCAFIQLVSGNHAGEWKYTDYYFNSSAGKNGGGLVGGTVCKLFCTWFGVVGAYIIDIVLMIIGMVVISEHSFINGIKKQSHKAYDTAKHDVEQYRESTVEKRKKRDEIKLERASKKARGVPLDIEIPKNGMDMSAKPKEKKTHDISDIDKEPYRFEKADSFFSGDVVPFEAEKYKKSRNVTDYATRHFEEEQSSPFEASSYDDKFDEVIEHDTFDAEPEPQNTEDIWNNEEAENMPDIDYTEPIIDTDLVRSEFEKENAHVEIEQAKPVVHKKPAKYTFPPLNLLKKNTKSTANTNNKEQLKETAMKLQRTLANFGVKVTVTDVSCGPAVTRYEIQPEQGVKVSKIVSLADDIKLNLAAADIRIEAPIPGKAAVGIEVPNKETSGVMLGDLLSSQEFKKTTSVIAFAAGKDIGGQTVIADIAKMPHLLIAGATGSGKSVCINTIIMSILYKARPDEVKLIMVDPKVVELSVYNGIPHLLIPVVTDPKKAAAALNWAVAEMTDRYKKFADFGVRDLKGYNEKLSDAEPDEEGNTPEKLPQIVIIVDELADLMMVSSNEVEDAIVRLSQLARAAGIHMVIATQRPSVNVITGLIKANVPSRIAFSVSSGVDSRTIIDMNGAEKLLGKGDMLFYPQGYQKPVRVQGAFVSDDEVAQIVDFIKVHSDQPEENPKTENILTAGFKESQAFDNDRDQYFGEAGKFIIEKERASIGMLQRVYKIGFNRAARIMDQLCEAGVVGPEEGTKPRKVLMTMEEFMEYLNNN